MEQRDWNQRPSNRNVRLGRSRTVPASCRLHFDAFDAFFASDSDANGSPASDEEAKTSDARISSFESEPKRVVPKKVVRLTKRLEGRFDEKVTNL